MIASWILCLAASPSLPIPDLFRDIALEAAIFAAEVERKVVLVAFVAPGTPDSRKLEATTWSDPKVRDWLTKKAVPIRVDVEKHVDLAERFRIHVVPTIVLLSAKGNELDRLPGYVDASTLQKEGDAILAGSDPVARIRKRLPGHEKDPNVRIDLAGALCDRGLLPESMAEYLWCWDHGVENDPTFKNTRSTFLLKEIQRLARLYTPALDALASRASVLFERLTDCEATADQLADYVAIQELLDRGDKILDAYDVMREAGEPCAAMLAPIVPHALTALVDARRYAEACELAGDVVSDLFARVAAFEVEVKLIGAERGDTAALAIEKVRRTLRLELARRYEALVGDRRYEYAAEYATRVLAFDPRGPMYAVLIQAAVRAEAHGPARSIEVRASGNTKLTEAERREVRAAARFILQPK